MLCSDGSAHLGGPVYGSGFHPRPIGQRAPEISQDLVNFLQDAAQLCCEQKQCLRRQYTTNKESWMLYKETQEVATHGKYFSRTVLKILTMLEKWNGFVFSKSVTFHKSLT